MPSTALTMFSQETATCGLALDEAVVFSDPQLFFEVLQVGERRNRDRPLGRPGRFLSRRDPSHSQPICGRLLAGFLGQVIVRIIIEPLLVVLQIPLDRLGDRPEKPGWRAQSLGLPVLHRARCSMANARASGVSGVSGSGDTGITRRRT